MGNLRSRPLAVLLVVLALVLTLAGVLYAIGAISFLTTHPNGAHHYPHAVVMGVLALACLTGASMVRPRSV